MKHNENIEECGIDRFKKANGRHSVKRSYWQRELDQRRVPLAKNRKDITTHMLTLPNAGFPMEFWSKGWVLKAILDTDWLEITKDADEVFPAKPANPRPDDSPHPGYVWEEIRDEAIEICPLTGNFQSRSYYIDPEDTLEPTGEHMYKRSYLALRSRSVLPRDNTIFLNMPKFLGIFPPHCLHSVREGDFNGRD